MYKTNITGPYFLSKAGENCGRHKQCIATMPYRNKILSCISNFSETWSFHALGFWCGTVFGYKASDEKKWEGMSNDVAYKVTRLDLFRFLYIGLSETYCLFCSDTISIYCEKKDYRSTCSSEYWSLRKDMETFQYKHFKKPSSGHIEQHSIWIRLLEYFY